MGYLAMGYQVAGKLAKALPLFKEAATGIELRRFQHEHVKHIISNTIAAYEAAKQFDKVETWRRKWLAMVKAEAGAESPAYALELASLGLPLSKLSHFAEAEAVLRECLAIREKTQPDVWSTFNIHSMLGGTLLGQKKYAEAEMLLLKGYAGLKQREAAISKSGKIRLDEALERLVALYTDWHAVEPDKGYEAKAAEWQMKLNEHKAVANAETPATNTGVKERWTNANSQCGCIIVGSLKLVPESFKLKMRNSRFLDLVCSTLLLLFFLMLSLRQVKADDSIPKILGMADTRPPSGPFVPIDEGKKGYMVPYVQKLGDSGASFEMIPVPGGRVTVGSPQNEVGHRPDEGPTYSVELAPFWIGKTEVTWGDFEGFMESHLVFKKHAANRVRQVTTSNRADAVTVPTLLYAPAHHKEFGDDPKHPAVTMTQYSAKQYTKWLSGITGVQYRLPTEAEWEYAARAGSQSAYCFGDSPSILDEYAVHSQSTCGLVASKKPNPFGLYDMHGNVWEWTIEQYSPTGYIAHAGKSFAGLEATQWATKLDLQCVRGGCWNDAPDRVRSASRMGSDRSEWAMEDPEIPQSPWWYTSDPSRMVGMRLVRSATPLNKKWIDRFWENEIQELQDYINASVQEGRGIEGLPIPALLKELKWK